MYSAIGGGEESLYILGFAFFTVHEYNSQLTAFLSYKHS